MRIGFIYSVLLITSGFCYSGESILGIDRTYRESCIRAVNDPMYFNNFRSNNDYSHALELEATQEFADYLTVNASEETKNKLTHFERLDQIGNPRTKFFLNAGKFSGTTLRYILVADQIKKLFTLPENPKVVEIGAGFGGQCYILSNLISFSKYYIYDLPEVEALIDKVMNVLGVNDVITLPIDEIIPEKVDLFISNYAFSECDRLSQLTYFENVIKNSDRGYVIYNQIAQFYHLNSLSPDEFVTLLEVNGINPKMCSEPVSTYTGNVLIIWDKTSHINL